MTSDSVHWIDGRLAGQVTTGRRGLLSEAVSSLAGAVTAQTSPAPGQFGAIYPRSALLHATFLARAWLMRGDLESAVAVRTLPRCFGRSTTSRSAGTGSLTQLI
jgi:hypothetical protein